MRDVCLTLEDCTTNAVDHDDDDDDDDDDVAVVFFFKTIDTCEQ